MSVLNVSILGGSGYAGGELLRLLLDHPDVTVAQVWGVVMMNASKPSTNCWWKWTALSPMKA